MLETLLLADVPDLHMDLGHVGIYRGLARAASLSGDAEQRLFDALQRKAMDEIAALTANVEPALASMLRALARLCGGRETLDAAREVLAGAPAPVLQSLEGLAHIAEQLAMRYPELPLYFDLGELRGYHYHTGVVFAVFVPGVGQSIAQGGRYDDIGADFGRARPATGFSTDLKTLVRLGNAELVGPLAGIWAPYSADPTLWQTIRRLREQGERVVQALDGQQSDVAPGVGCDRQLLLQEGSWVVTPLVR
jgi:ATP phosphoribosyltransferase regulatory subunit